MTDTVRATEHCSSSNEFHFIPISASFSRACEPYSYPPKSSFPKVPFWNYIDIRSAIGFSFELETVTSSAPEMQLAGLTRCICSLCDLTVPKKNFIDGRLA